MFLFFWLQEEIDIDFQKEFLDEVFDSEDERGENVSKNIRKTAEGVKYCKKDWNFNHYTYLYFI